MEDASKVEPDPEWAKVWAGAWGGMARTDPDAHWVYQGWAIRGWGDAKGMSRLKALYDTVPKGKLWHAVFLFYLYFFVGDFALVLLIISCSNTFTHEI